MNNWNPGDRVEHATFGAGTVLESNAQHIVIHFDRHGRRKLAAGIVTLAPSATADPHRAPARSLRPDPRPVEVAPQPRASAAGVPATIDELIDLARQNVGSEKALDEFVSSMRKALSGPGQPHVGVLSGMRMQAFQNWMLNENAGWQLTDGQLLALLRVEFPLATGQLHTGDIDTGLHQIAGLRAHYNRDGSNSPSGTSRRLPLSESYGRF